MMVVGLLALTLALFGIWASFILKEKIFDERDAHNRTEAGRNAFIVGSALLIIGIGIQGYTHTVDPWLVITFSAMIITKIATRIWNDKNL